ncbi:MAG: SPASM domain-containing protein [Nitrososphaerota archaeon]
MIMYEGIPGAFSLVERTMEVLKRYKDIRRNVSMTVTPFNFSHFLKVKQYAIKHNADFGFQIVQISPAYFSNTERTKTLTFSPITLREMLKTVRSHSRSWQNKPSTLYDLEMKLAYSYGKYKQMIPCFSGFHSFALSPEGGIYPCLVFDVKFGNITKENFQRIWKSRKAREIWKKIAKGNCPGCWLECEIARSIIENWPLIIRRFL